MDVWTLWTGLGLPGLVVTTMLGLCAVSCLVAGLVPTADGIKWILEKIAHITGWMLIVLMFVTCMDIVFRRLQLPIALTQFQEAEWHLHTIIFSGWMGYNYAINAHPRVDSYTGTLSFRTKAWLELIFLVILAFPFLYVMLKHGWPWVVTSYVQNEASENVTGLPFRWAIKAVFFAGIWLVFFGALSVFLRLIAFLFRDVGQDESGLDLGHIEMEA
jgi:TRAP-type mannitol/chloroaromatic compound transport system permease small subunit